MARVLRSPSFALLWSAQLASLIAGFFNYVAVAWLVLNLTGSTLAVGAVLAAASIPTAVLMLLGGAVSDRFSPRRSMLVAALVRSVVVAIVASLTLAGAVALWQLFAAAVVVGSTTAFLVPASGAMLPRLVEREQLQAGNALLNLGRTLAMVAGSAIAGVAVAAVGPGPALAVDAVASLLAAILVVPLPRAHEGSPAPSTGSSRVSPLMDIREGLRYVWRDVPLRTILVVIAVLNFGALGAIEVGLPALAYARLSEGATALGVTFAAWGIGSTVGAIVAGTRGIPARFGRFVALTIALLGLGIAAAGLASSLPMLIVVMGLLGLVEGGATTFFISWMQGRTDPSMQGRVMAIAMLASIGLEPLALAIAGAIAAIDLGLLFWASAAALELTAIGTLLARGVRQV